jgi:hypothetical protein
MGTRFTTRSDGKIDKPPYRVRRGLPVVKADKTDEDSWATFEEALAALERGEVDAIGFVFSKGDRFFVVDLDRVVDPETGEIVPAAEKIIHALNTYTELSCSGTGAHAIGAGQKPDWAKCKIATPAFDIEVYDQKRFVVMTGNTICGRGALQERQQELEALCERLWPKQESAPKSPPNTGPVDLEDSVLLERARTSRSGPKFHKLYDLGDTSGYSSHSNADYALLNMLIFWTGGDRERIISLFEASALYRQREKHRNYAALSVENALASYAGPFYKVRLTKEAREQEEQDPLTPYLQLLLDPSQWTGRKGASAFKATAALVLLSQESGIIDDEGTLRTGCDIRRLSEVAGVSTWTLSTSTLPYLIQEKKLLRWRRGKGTKAGVFVVKKPSVGTLNTKVSTHFSVKGLDAPKNALETLRLLIRMRYGYSKADTLLKLGMPAMFVAVALASSNQHTRGYTATELAERTGRREQDLKAEDGPLRRLKAAGIARETSEGVYRLTENFEANYARALEYSGITFAERAQRRRHEVDREERAKDLAKRAKKRGEEGHATKPTTRLRGIEQMKRIQKRKREEAERRGETEERREGPKDVPAPGEVQGRIVRLVREGMSERFARMAVLVPDHQLDCGCEVCG